MLTTKRLGIPGKYSSNLLRRKSTLLSLEIPKIFRFSRSLSHSTQKLVFFLTFEILKRNLGSQVEVVIFEKCTYDSLENLTVR